MFGLAVTAGTLWTTATTTATRTCVTPSLWARRTIRVPFSMPVATLDVQCLLLNSLSLSTGRQSYYSEECSKLLVNAPSSGSNRNYGIATTDLLGNNGASDGDCMGMPSLSLSLLHVTLSAPVPVSVSVSGTTSHDCHRSVRRYVCGSAARGGRCGTHAPRKSQPHLAGVFSFLLGGTYTVRNVYRARGSQHLLQDVQGVLVHSADQNDPSNPDWIINGAGLHYSHKYLTHT